MLGSKKISTTRPFIQIILIYTYQTKNKNFTSKMPTRTLTAENEDGHWVKHVLHIFHILDTNAFYKYETLCNFETLKISTKLFWKILFKKINKINFANLTQWFVLTNDLSDIIKKGLLIKRDESIPNDNDILSVPEECEYG
jgi:hypothetical protein